MYVCWSLCACEKLPVATVFSNASIIPKNNVLIVLPQLKLCFAQCEVLLKFFKGAKQMPKYKHIHTSIYTEIHNAHAYINTYASTHKQFRMNKTLKAAVETTWKHYQVSFTLSTEIILPCNSVLCRCWMHFEASSVDAMVTNP